MCSRYWFTDIDHLSILIIINQPTGNGEVQRGIKLDEIFQSRPYSQIFNLNVNRGLANKAGKRDKLEIYYDILHTFYAEEHSSSKSKQSLAKIASQVNMPYNRFKKTLIQLNSLKLLIIDSKRAQVTEKGLEFIMEYQSFNNYLKQIGLVKEPPRLFAA